MTAFAPLSLADPSPLCSDVTDSAVVNEAGFYVIGNQVWLEHNNFTGLQRQFCDRGDGVVIGSDTFVTTLSANQEQPDP